MDHSETNSTERYTMPDPEKYVAIEIDSPAVWEILIALDPRFAELSYEFNYGFFVVLNHDNALVSIMSPETVGVHFDHIETNDTRIKTVTLVK